MPKEHTPGHPGLQRVRDELQRLRAQHLYRIRRVLESPQGVEVRVDGENLLAFCSNDYLGLANNARVTAAFQNGAQRHGVGSGASHLVTGHSVAHHALEEELAAFVGAERVLLFSTGYMANLGVVSALLDRHATVFEDKLNHASLIDAARMSGARVQRYAHGDLTKLATQLDAKEGDGLILTDGVFSMDGDVADVARMAALAQRYAAWLLVDDAHGLGVLGAHGRGTLERFGLRPQTPLILLGTLGKAFGTFGAFIAGDEDLVEYLIQRARPYIYTTALPPAVAEATRASLHIVREEGWRRDVLNARIAQFRAGAAQLGLTLLDSPTPIQALILGEAHAAVAASEALRARGILVPAIRPPTVPAGSARLRITFSAQHSAQQVERLLAALAELPPLNAGPT
ncbi:MAG TPA: 8-amino-7-oxononanoate synthase [Acidiferrobacterales bacterium]|nr:8-amino-7-oxononanoate synthase [Acidiferrobacterales bacterium]